MQAVQTVKSYLLEVGFKQPVIIPTMAHAAKIFRMAAQGEQLTRRERSDIRSLHDLLLGNPHRLLNVTKVENDVRLEIVDGINGDGHSLLHKSLDKIGVIKVGTEHIHHADLERAVYSTGIHTIETILEKQIFTEALPETMERVSKVMRKHNAHNLQQWLQMVVTD